MGDEGGGESEADSRGILLIAGTAQLDVVVGASDGRKASDGLR